MKVNLLQKRVLIIGAHPDDVEIGCGGTIAKHVKNGDFALILIMTNSFFTNYDGKVLRTEQEGENEARVAAQVLGAELIHLDFETKNVPYSSETIECINEIIDTHNIDTIYTHWFHDTHQDHIRTTQSVLSAARYVPNLLMYEPEYPAGRSHMAFRNQYYVDISETIDLKMESLSKHTSQVNKYGDKFLKAVEARAQHRGYEISSSYAECFEVVRLKGEV